MVPQYSHSRRPKIVGAKKNLVDELSFRRIGAFTENLENQCFYGWRFVAVASKSLKKGIPTEPFSFEKF